MQTDTKPRCSWCLSHPLYIKYHDEEWGVPVHDDNKLFEMLTLEGAQAGLSWFTILSKRENYRKAFDNFDPGIVAKYDESKYEELMQNPGIVRNKLKIRSTINNAARFLEIQSSHGSFNNYIWQFTDGKPLVNNIKSLSQVPPKTQISDKMSKDLLGKGFKFVGSTICYAFMQAVGIVDDHVEDCWKK